MEHLGDSLTFNKHKQNSLFPTGPVIKCFVIPPFSKIEKSLWKNCLLDAEVAHKFAMISGAWIDHVRVESSSCCFP